MCNTSRDGRMNSVMDEDTIITMLQAQSDIGRYVTRPSSTRHWYDFRLESTNVDSDSENICIACNIKVSKGGTNNALSKKALVYTYSTLSDDEIPSNLSFNNMVELIESNMRESRNTNYDKEYFYIYIDKVDKTVIVRSICDIQNYVSSAQNWLQINWDREKKIQDSDILLQSEDIHDSYTRVRGVLRDSLEKIINSSDKL